MPTRRSHQDTRDSASRSSFIPGSLNRTRAFWPASSGVIVLIAIPPLPMFSVSAAAIVFSKRYATGMPSTTLGLLRRLKLSGKR